jgi:peptide/nickel transport system permease protein
MRRYLLHRLIAAPCLLLGVLTVTFLLVHAAPGEPFSMEPSAGTSRESAGRMRALFGADAPLHVQYARWLDAAARLDFGVSYTHRRPVASVLGAALPPTLLLMGSALALALAAGAAAACGVVAARRPALDRALELLATAAYAAPAFWVGVVLVQLMTVRLGWLPGSGWRSLDAAGSAGLSMLDIARHLLLPAVTLALPAAAGIALHLHAGLRESLEGAPTRTELARGASRLRVVRLHLRNTAAPVAALIGHTLPALVGGSLVIEVLFAWPGMGRITYEAILGRDLPVILAAVSLSTALAVAGSLAADVACALADPRVVLGRRDTAAGNAP